jgi:Rab-GTPase-TBC domain
MEESNFDPSLMAFQWFVGFFTNNLPEEVITAYTLIIAQTSLKVWDLLMVIGVKVLFYTALSILTIFNKSLLKSTDFCKNPFPLKFY